MDLSKFENKIFSQNGEDGILEKICKVISVKDKFYVESRVYDGTERNTKYLMEKKGWKGILFDDVYANIKENLYTEFFHYDNTSFIFTKYDIPKDFDLLSLHINYNNFYILKKILLLGYKPRIIVTQYNSYIDPKEDKIVVYNDDYKWEGTDYFDASSLSYKKLLEEFGYSIIYYEKSGNNLFAVLKEYEKKFKVNKPVYNKVFTNWKYFQDFYKREYISYEETKDEDIMISINMNKYIHNITETDKKYNSILESNKNIEYSYEKIDSIKKSLYDYLLLVIQTDFSNILEKYKNVLFTLIINQFINSVKKKIPNDTIEFVYGSNYNDFVYSNIYFYRILHNSIFIQKRIQKGYLFEHINLIILHSYMRKSDIAIDVGSNIGTITVPLSKMVEKVYSFEPIKDIYKLLEYNIKRNNINNVVISKNALSNKKNNIYLKNILYNKTKYTIFDFDVDTKVQVETIDELQIKNVGLIKIEITNMEMKILEGAKETIKKYKPIILCKFTPNISSSFNIFDFCRKHGYNTIIESRGNNYFIIPENKKPIIKDPLLQLRRKKSGKESLYVQYSDYYKYIYTYI